MIGGAVDSVGAVGVDGGHRGGVHSVNERTDYAVGSNVTLREIQKRREYICITLNGYCQNRTSPMCRCHR